LSFYYFVLIVVVACLVAIERILSSPFGRVLEAIRESEERARACGYNSNRILLLAFLFAGLFAGVAGALYALFFGFIGLETLSWVTAGVVVMAGPILRTERVVRYYGGVRALNGVDLQIQPGVLHAVIGPNGAGKSTLFHVITGRVPATSGRIWFRGLDITGRSQPAIAQLG